MALRLIADAEALAIIDGRGVRREVWGQRVHAVRSEVKAGCVDDKQGGVLKVHQIGCFRSRGFDRSSKRRGREQREEQDIELARHRVDSVVYSIV